MKAQQHKTEFSAKFENEIERISQFYGLDFSEIKAGIKPIHEYFENYWEMVFAKNGFEIITSGTGNSLIEKIGRVAIESGISEKTVLMFEACCQAFPNSIIGIKLVFSKNATYKPTLYVRTKTEVNKGIKFLEDHLSIKEISDLRTALKNNQILYGLGFSEKNNRLYLKTYTIDNVLTANGQMIKGFVSCRLTQDKLLKEHKSYLPDISLSTFKTSDPRLNTVLKFLNDTMKYSKAGHIGMLHENDKPVEYKIYIERRGGIPTDFSAR